MLDVKQWAVIMYLQYGDTIWSTRLIRGLFFFSVVPQAAVQMHVFFPPSSASVLHGHCPRDHRCSVRKREEIARVLQYQWY